jgi:hypothetical protein
MFHYATISQGEVDLLRRIAKVIRNGRVTGIEPGKLVFAESEAAVPDDSLFIDCTATAVRFSTQSNTRSIFDGETITLKPLHVPLVTFSAALCAFLEANYDSDDARNALATPAALTDTPATFPYGFLMSMMNRGKWTQDPMISAWLAKSRLDLTSGLIAKLVADNSPKLAILGKFRQAASECMPSVVKLGMQAKAVHEGA